MRCASCDEAIKHDDGRTCAGCGVAEHDACAEGWGRDSGGDTFCESCCTDQPKWAATMVRAAAKVGAAKHARAVTA